MNLDMTIESWILKIGGSFYIYCVLTGFQL